MFVSTVMPVLFQILLTFFVLLLPIRVKEAQNCSIRILQIMFKEVVQMSNLCIYILADCRHSQSLPSVLVAASTFLCQGRWVATPENLRVLAETLLEVCMHMAPWIPLA